MKNYLTRAITTLKQWMNALILSLQSISSIQFVNLFIGMRIIVSHQLLMLNWKCIRQLTKLFCAENV